MNLHLQYSSNDRTINLFRSRMTIHSNYHNNIINHKSKHLDQIFNNMISFLIFHKYLFKSILLVNNQIQILYHFQIFIKLYIWHLLRISLVFQYNHILILMSF